VSCLPCAVTAPNELKLAQALRAGFNGAEAAPSEKKTQPTVAAKFAATIELRAWAVITT
jgi:hypothetical protein